MPVLAAGARQLPHLDLEPPSLTLAGTGSALGTGHFTRAERFRAPPSDAALAGEPAAHFAIDVPHAPEGSVAGLAQRFRREGLPIARLWQNHQAMLSLGLNQRGKPGLWLVQKTH